MRNLKKFLALVLAMLMTFSLMLTVNAASPVDFPDEEKITAAYQEAVDVLSALKVVKGDAGTGNFRPASDISRAEAAAILYRVVTGDVEDKNIHLYEGSGYFSDLAPDAWYEGYVNYCANNGLILGRGNNKFDPDAPVTGYEALVMILRAIGYNNPKEFSDPDWKLKASGYGRRLGITANIAEGSLGGSAKREVVAEIMFQGIQTTCVKYTMLNDYQPVVWHTYVDKDGKVTGYRYEDLLLRYFDIAGKSATPTRDKWGNPSVQWIKWSTGAVAIEIKIDPLDTFYTAMDECDLVEKYNKGADIPVDNEFLNGRAVVKGGYTDSDGYSGYTRKLDKLHTTDDFVGAQGRETKIYNYTIKANGITNTYWDIVYVDTYLGVIKTKTPKMTDTNNHEMQKASFGIEVGDYNATNGYAVLHVSDADYAKYNVGDVVTLNTWSPSYWNGSDTMKLTVKHPTNAKNNLIIDLSNVTDGPLTVDRLTTKASAVSPKTVTQVKNIGVQLQQNGGTPADATGATYTYTISGTQGWRFTRTADGVYTVEYEKGDNSNYGNDFLWNTHHDFDTDKFAIVDKAAEKTVTITGTTGAAGDKTGIYTADGTTMANIVFHMDRHTVTTDAVAANNNVPTTATDFIQTSGGAHGIFNEQIGKSYKLWLDGQGNILGMKPETAAGVGVVLNVEAVAIATGQYALKADIFMEDESTLTAMFLDDVTNAGQHTPFTGASAATDAVDDYADGSKVNGGAKFAANALVEVEPYTWNGKTFYKVVDHDSDYNPATPAYGTVVDSNGAGSNTINVVSTGVTNTFNGGNTDRVNGDTVFFVAYKDFQYNWGTGNTGANANFTWKVVRDFRDIPTISGEKDPTNTADDTEDNVAQQTLKPNAQGVAKYAAITTNDPTETYNMTAKQPVQVDDSYLIIKPIGTYERYSEYSVLHNGVKETLKVANLNTGVNTDVEIAMASGQLIKIKSWGLDNVANEVEFIDNSNVVKSTTTVSYDNAGVLTIKVGAAYSAGVDSSHVANANSSVTVNPDYLTMAKDVKVVIVNRDRDQVYEGTTSSIALYASYTNGHAFAWELDANGYIGTLYILD